MVTLQIELQDEDAEALKRLAAAGRRSEAEIMSEALTIYVRTKRPLPQGIGQFRSGYSDTGANARAIIRKAVEDGEWP